jgi:hypothetical protein
MTLLQLSIPERKGEEGNEDHKRQENYHQFIEARPWHRTGVGGGGIKISISAVLREQATF